MVKRTVNLHGRGKTREGENVEEVGSVSMSGVCQRQWMDVAFIWVSAGNMTQRIKADSR